MLTSFKPHISSLFVKKPIRDIFWLDQSSSRATRSNLVFTDWAELFVKRTDLYHNAVKTMGLHWRWKTLEMFPCLRNPPASQVCSKVFMMFWCAEVKLGYSVYICMNKSTWDTPLVGNTLISGLIPAQEMTIITSASCLLTSSSCLIRGTFQSASTPLGHILAVPFAMSRADGQTDPEPLPILSSPKDSQHLVWKTIVRRIHKRAQKFERGNVKEEKCNF